ncbi:MAG: hypothetical protein M1825_001488 [Sarcosagium campestre]|nr:MAG: hypothetical protein M1825_001488 [Sarcosagium campestre]
MPRAIPTSSRPPTGLAPPTNTPATPDYSHGRTHWTPSTLQTLLALLAKGAHLGPPPAPASPASAASAGATKRGRGKRVPRRGISRTTSRKPRSSTYNRSPPRRPSRNATTPAAISHHRNSSSSSSNRAHSDENNDKNINDGEDLELDTMYLSTQLNESLHATDFGSDIPHAEIDFFIRRLLASDATFRGVLERHPVGKVTRMLTMSFNRAVVAVELRAARLAAVRARRAKDAAMVMHRGGDSREDGRGGAGSVGGGRGDVDMR